MLLTDGNQTLGNDYQFINTNNSVFPVVIGDTLQYEDLYVSKVNANKYSFIKNQFPVEIFVNYDGKSSITSRLRITKNGRTIFSKKL